MNRFFLPLIYLLVAVGLFYGVTRAQIDKVEVLRAEKGELVAALDRAKELHQVAERLRTEYYSFSEEERARLNKMIPDNVDNVRLIIDINNIATRYDMVVKDAKIKTEERAVAPNAQAAAVAAAAENPSAVLIDNPGGQISQGTVGITFTVVGSYTVFRQFLGDLASSLRLVDIRKITFKTTDKDDIYQYSVDLNTYWLK